MNSDDLSEERQRVERVPGRARRSRLTLAPGTDSDPGPGPVSQNIDESAAEIADNLSADDNRIKRERPPHW